MGNKADEQACLDFAVKACLAQHGISKRIGLLLSGEDIQRDNDERPDFMRLSTSSGDHGSVVLGIEHFRVDHFSRELTNNRVGSYGIGYEKNLKRSVDTWQPQISSDKEIPAGALKSIGELVAQLLSQQIQATYNSFISAFSYSLNKHIESIDFYHSQLERYAGNYEKKLAFLIEIHSDFHKLFFHDKNGTHYGEKTIPLFDELVTIMEKIDPRKVHYLILCFGDTVYNDSTKVIAVPTKNLRGHLAKRNIPIYHYAGHDICLSGFQTPRLDFKATSDYERQGDRCHRRNGRRTCKRDRRTCRLPRYRSSHQRGLRRFLQRTFGAAFDAQLLRKRCFSGKHRQWIRRRLSRQHDKSHGC